MAGTFSKWTDKELFGRLIIGQVPGRRLTAEGLKEILDELKSRGVEIPIRYIPEEVVDSE